MISRCRFIWVSALALAAGSCDKLNPVVDTTKVNLPQAQTPVMRVVSINPCIDAVLMQIADPSQIAGISHYSKDPRATSISLEQARQFQATSGTAEEVIALSPQLVLSGGHVAPSTITALKRLKIPLVQLSVPETIAESREQIAILASAIGQQKRGALLNSRIDKAVRDAAPQDSNKISALIWQGGGLVPGKGTLASELLNVSGFQNISAAYGLKKWDILPLEHLIARPPDVLLSIGAINRTDRRLGHPVLKSLKQKIDVRAYPERLLHCGGPTIIDAVGYLSTIRSSL